MTTRPDRSAGFSLIEVMVAFVILSLVVAMCLQVYTRSAEAEAKARWSDEAYALVRDRLASFDTLGLRPGQQTGGETGDGLRWRVGIAQPASLGGENVGRGVIWVTAEVTDPAGQTYAASTARWLDEMSTGGFE
jgi:general secretion pathway protein I